MTASASRADASDPSAPIRQIGRPEAHNEQTTPGGPEADNEGTAPTASAIQRGRLSPSNAGSSVGHVPGPNNNRRSPARQVNERLFQQDARCR